MKVTTFTDLKRPKTNTETFIDTIEKQLFEKNIKRV